MPTLPPFNLDTYSHDGPMGRTMADVALLQNVIAGAHPIDHTSMRFPPVLPLDPEPITGLRIAVARTIGWISQWKEMIGEKNQKIGRPRQLYIGAARRDVVPLAQRG